MTSVSAGHIILTPTQPVGSGWPQRGSNPGTPHQESRATKPQKTERKKASHLIKYSFAPGKTFRFLLNKSKYNGKTSS